MLITKYLEIQKLNHEDLLKIEYNTLFEKKKDILTNVGRYLLYSILEEKGFLDIESPPIIKYNYYGRPYLCDIPIDFNISHKKEIVVCSVSSKGFVGVDIEKQATLNISTYNQILCKKEIDIINNATDKLACFYELWTKKEAVIKGEGLGFFMPIPNFENTWDYYKSSNHIWHIYTKRIKKEYILSIASNVIEQPLISEHKL
ncbi:4'-phosphopantetheinyl transferase family protein [Bacteroides ovatus]|uniref:4'-phosphopantetheinyl transferase family protein n=1 Tax=Bacteroides ovatus TaxID=28116 RepID=UPI000E4A68D7|nr:4'-phosphopantetheinyl transferase superfamily protein [Bacteroides ovatus]RGR15253.1 hypothetical protein DWY64_20210 [Bacteroides ovatus]